MGAVVGALEAPAGGDADDAPAPLCEHVRRYGPAAQKRPEQVGADDPFPFVLGHVRHRAGGIDAGVVDQDIDRAEAVEAGMHHGFHGGFLRHVGGVGKGGAAVVFDLLLNGTGVVFPQLGDNDRCPLFGHGQRDGLTDSLPAPRHYGRPAFESVHRNAI